MIPGGGGLALFGNKYSDLENAENKSSVLFWKEKKVISYTSKAIRRRLLITCIRFLDIKKYFQRRRFTIYLLIKFIFYIKKVNY